ncbi:MAG TPA: 16S rRNA (cytosine(1402)-N(4))-methyltransferase RsmH [Acidobacteriaceae bacterium]
MRAEQDDTPQGERRPERERHVPVLLKEAMELLQVRPGGVYVDATLGFAGHASAMMQALAAGGAGGKLIGFDRDPEAMALSTRRLQELAGELGPAAPVLELHNVEFSQMGLEQGEGAIGAGSLDGILADFGTSSMHFDDAHRGFSFQADGPLDMRMNPRGGITAEQVVNQADENDLANLIYEFGEERRSRRIARAIVRARPLHTTAQLAQVVKAAAPPMNHGGIHPATRTFQALRIQVNGELAEITALLEAAPRLLKAGGRLVVISFHSLEDRLAKDALRAGAQQGIYEVLTRKPVVAGEAETERNPRARSAKLRAAVRLGAGPKDTQQAKDRSKEGRGVGMRQGRR